MKAYAELEHFVRKHYATLYAVALKFVKSPDCAEDITQEVLIHYWEISSKGSLPDSEENYLYTMVRNEALNHLRSLKREQERYNKLEIPESEDPEICRLILEEETNHQLNTAINTLPKQSARIIRLALSGYENKEIARLLQISINTVKTLKYSAIRKLHEYFNPPTTTNKERR